MSMESRPLFSDRLQINHIKVIELPNCHYDFVLMVSFNSKQSEYHRATLERELNNNFDENYLVITEDSLQHAKQYNANDCTILREFDISGYQLEDLQHLLTQPALQCR